MMRIKGLMLYHITYVLISSYVLNLQCMITHTGQQLYEKAKQQALSEQLAFTADESLKTSVHEALLHHYTNKRSRSGRNTLSLMKYLISNDLMQNVEVQNFVIDLLLNMVIMSGGQYAEQLITEQYKAQQTKLTNQIRALQESFKDTQTRIKQKSTQVIQTVDQTFATQLQNIENTEGQAQKKFAQEVTYIQRLINVNIPPSRLIVNGITADLFFGASAMVTPSNGYTWHNVFPNNNWLFDGDTGSFVHQGPIGGLPATVQLGLKKNWYPANATDLSGPPTPDNGGLNHIFTEYFTSQAAYQIQVEVTLINVTYPFCAAVLCNKARWLSGSLDRMNSYRLIGLYGTQTGNTTQVGLYAGQTTFLQLGTLAIATSPLNPIFSGATQPLYTFSPNDVQHLGTDPLTMRITIVTQQASLAITLETQTATGWKTLTNASISNFNPNDNALLFWYHGIGFMAPGCQASFKIVQPKELAYTAQQLATFSAQQKKDRP